MNIHHQIYAATCKNRGFGVFYQSPGLSLMGEDTLNVIKKNATYKEPYLLNSNTEVDRYPVNYEYYYVPKVGGVRSVLAFSKYTGATNHTPDRKGNFITHSVVFDGSLDNCHIPCLMESIPFKRSLTIEEEANFMAPMDTFEFTEENKLSLVTKNIRFLNASECYINAFLEVIDMILGGWLDCKGKNITISAPTNQECIDLIFAIYSILPSYIINHFSFATYVVSPSIVSFQICGVIPECGVTKLDPEYFKLIRVDIPSNTYTPAYKFTRILKGWIANERVEKIVNIEKLFHDYGITRLDKSVEIPFTIEEFKEGISNKSLSELNAILRGDSLVQQKQRKDLHDYVFRENPNLYLEYITQEAKSYIAKKHSVSSHLGVVEKFFQNLHSSYSDKQLLAFYKEVESVFYDKTTINSKLLLDEFSDIRSIIKGKPLLCEYLLLCSDKQWSSVDEQDKEDIVKEYRDWLIAKRYPNIQSWFSFKGIMNEIRNETFLEKVSDYHDVLLTTSKENRVAIFKELIETTNKKGHLTDKSIFSIILLVDKYLDESFWKRLVEVNDVNDNDKDWMKFRKTWSLSMIKRYYIYYYVLQHEGLSKVSDMIESLDDYETRWVLERLIENHQKDGHERLQSVLLSRMSKKRDGGWLINRILSKKSN